MSSSMHVHNKRKNMLILCEGLTWYHINSGSKISNPFFSQWEKRFVLTLHYNGSNSFLFVNVTKVCQFKAKELEIKDDALCLGNISKDFTINNLKKQD